MSRVRLRVPPPHVALHGCQSPHVLTSQCHGQGPWSHVRVSCVSPKSHTARLRTCFPTPHVTLHAPHPLHVLTLQRAWQGKDRQSCFSVVGGQHGNRQPGSAAMSRDLVLDPTESQDVASHAPQRPQSPTEHVFPAAAA